MPDQHAFNVDTCVAKRKPEVDIIIIIIIITGIYIALFQSMIKAHNKRIGKIKTGKNITKQNLKSTH